MADCRACGGRIPLKADARPRLYCSKACKEAARDMRRAMRQRQDRSQRKSTALYDALRAETPKGCCPYCDGMLAPYRGTGPRPKTCGADECLEARRRDYNTTWYLAVVKPRRALARFSPGTS